MCNQNYCSGDLCYKHLMHFFCIKSACVYIFSLELIMLLELNQLYAPAALFFKTKFQYQQSTLSCPYEWYTAVKRI